MAAQADGADVCTSSDDDLSGDVLRWGSGRGDRAVFQEPQAADGAVGADGEVVAGRAGGIRDRGSEQLATDAGELPDRDSVEHFPGAGWRRVVHYRACQLRDGDFAAWVWVVLHGTRIWRAQVAEPGGNASG